MSGRHTDGITCSMAYMYVCLIILSLLHSDVNCIRSIRSNLPLYLTVLPPHYLVKFECLVMKLLSHSALGVDV